MDGWMMLMLMMKETDDQLQNAAACPRFPACSRKLNPTHPTLNMKKKEKEKKKKNKTMDI